MGEGPIYPKDGFEPNRCRNDWWTNLLLINNLDVTTEKVRYTRKINYEI